MHDIVIRLSCLEFASRFIAFIPNHRTPTENTVPFAHYIIHPRTFYCPPCKYCPRKGCEFSSTRSLQVVRGEFAISFCWNWAKFKLKHTTGTCCFFSGTKWVILRACFKMLEARVARHFRFSLLIIRFHRRRRGCPFLINGEPPRLIQRSRR